MTSIFFINTITCIFTQAAYGFRQLDRLSGHGETPVLFVGDFNSLNTHPAYQLCTDGYLNDESIKT